MQLTVRDVAAALKVSENTVHRWITDRNLPAQQVNGQYRFNSVQLLEWATLNRLELGPLAFRNGGSALPRLDDALSAGGVLGSLPGTDKAGVLRALVQSLPLPESVDRDDLLQLFSARESSGSTAVGEGLAVPHPRQPLVMPGRPPSMTICYLAHPVDFGAADRQPVHTLFALLSPTVRAHLHLLARLIHALRDPDFRESLRHRASAEEMIEQAHHLEEKLAL